MIHARSLVKKFEHTTALSSLNLDIQPNQSFGILGPNGAGKSTFIGMTYGGVVRTSGELTVFGIDPNKNAHDIKKRLGVVTQDNALDESLTVFENMELYATFVGTEKRSRKKRIEELLEYMSLAHKKHAPIITLSGGMKRRLVFVRALLGQPELLILDEPTTGLDPAVRHLLWGKVKELRNQGTSILLTTHYMHEAEMLCDRLVIMNLGQIVAEGSPQELINKHTPGYVGYFAKDNLNAIKSASDPQKKYFIQEESTGLFVRAPQLNDITQLHTQLNLTPLQIRPANLEDVFLKLTGQEIHSNA